MITINSDLIFLSKIETGDIVKFWKHKVPNIVNFITAGSFSSVPCLGRLKKIECIRFCSFCHILDVSMLILEPTKPPFSRSVVCHPVCFIYTTFRFEYLLWTSHSTQEWGLWFLLLKTPVKRVATRESCGMLTKQIYERLLHYILALLRKANFNNLK